MKKSKSRSAFNISVVALFLIAAIVSFNVLNTLIFHILGIAFLIAGVYGIVNLAKRKEFLF